ncbi:MAG TPA: DUF6781 family protein [Burkholderiales bacterium]|nr:DUF6781 family protein [Burkholderiales bacterium]
MDTDEVLKGLARESVKQGENLRTAVREVTLSALRGRELTVEQIKRVVRTVTEGVNLGAATSKLDGETVLSEAFSGMDEAVLKAVQANHLALQQLSAQGQSLRDTQMKQALDQLERLEDAFMASVKEATRKGSKQVRDQWASVLQQKEAAGTATQTQIEATIEQFSDSMRDAVRQQRRTALKATEAMMENFNTLASGILIGLTEGLQHGKGKPGTKK